MLRRELLLGTAAALTAVTRGVTATRVERRPGTRYKLGLNAYSFNRELMDGSMSLDEVIDFCAEHSVDGVDVTGYYFRGYPNVPSDETIYKLKRMAFLNGVTISGTGVRNDFALTDASSRRGHIALVKDWVGVTQKLGADVLRVFSGREVAKGSSFEQTLEWMVPAFQDCADYAGEHGVILGLQHHHDFLKTADETLRLVEAVGSPWFQVLLDVGSLRTHDVYEEIERLTPFACTWQIKEEVWYGEEPKRIDLVRLKTIVDRTGYRGFLPVEALGRDADLASRKERVARFLSEVRQTFLPT
ncbi:MAG: sugar phosphate isomerase/epimerase family protein [Bryobacterales bacterium]